MTDKFMKSITFVEGGDVYYPLPKVTNVDDGRLLKVVDGEWSVEDFVPPSYLSFLGNEDFTLKTYNTTKNWDGTLEYSTDKSTWSIWNGTEISSSGKSLYLRGTGNTRITGSASNLKFVFTGTNTLKISCKGNIENLLDYETVSAGEHPTMADYCYKHLFQNCASLATAPELPATTLTHACYSSMFVNCTSLTAAPELPATELADYCYDSMFQNCISLTTAPALPATTSSMGCYRYMFYGCTALTTAPALPATTLDEDCYQAMFQNCTSLTTAPELPATKLTNNCYENMFYGCASLTTPPSVLPATRLAGYSCRRMFYGCTALTTAPDLPATRLDNYCYQSMFQNCTALTTAPELPATTLYGYCYNSMFYGCTSLITAPELPATTLDNYCYGSMFNRCTSLTTPPSVLPATTLVKSCYRFMFEFTAIEAIPRIMATTYATDSCKGMFDDIKTLNVYSTSGTGHTYGWTAPSSASTYCSGMFGSDDGESEWAKLDGSNFPNNGTPTGGTTYYFKTVPIPYLSFLGNEEFTLKTYNTTKNWDGILEYSTDTTTWNTWNGTEISSAGSKLYLRGTGNTKITGFSSDYRLVFTGTDALKIACEGNIENLLDYKTVSAGEHPTMAPSCYSSMFYGCTSLTTAPELPATKLTAYCYEYMFQGCTALTKAPGLPATTLANYCYSYMFQECTSLAIASSLPATTLADHCYHNMFFNCTSLTTVPALPATMLADYCYSEMFNRCTNIKLSTTKTGEYQIAYRIPTTGTGVTANFSLSSMFEITGGTFTGTPEINTTYYTSNTVV